MVQENRLEDLLMLHADHLNGSGYMDNRYELDRPSEDELASLTDLAVKVKRALEVRRPPESFTTRLGSALTRAAFRREDREVLLAPTTSTREVLVGAASVAVAGGILYLAHSLLQGRARSTSGMTT